MTDDVIRSMKAQMQPSDQVVSDLLAVIAAEKSSPVTAANNVVSLRQASVQKKAALAGTNTKAKTTKKRPVWYYGTAAASIIVLVSTFLFYGVSEGNRGPNLIEKLFEDIHPNSDYGDSDSIPAPLPSDEIVDFPADSDDTQTLDEEGSGIIDGNTAWEVSPVVSDSPAGDGGSASDNLSNSLNNDSDTANTNNGKITPGAPGTADISWTNELINSDAVSSISVSGSDYVVESTVSQSDVGSKIGSVTIDLPQTSSTNAAKLKASVLTVNSVSTDAMIALDVDGFTQPLAYSSTEYSPATLSEFIRDLDLGTDISFSSTIRCQISTVGYSAYTNYSKNIDNAVQSYLLSDGSAGRANYSAFNSGDIKLTFVSNRNATGSQLQFGVSSNGYLYISSSEKAYTFHIGSSNAKKFIEYVTGESLDSNGSSLKQNV